MKLEDIKKLENNFTLKVSDTEIISVQGNSWVLLEYCQGECYDVTSGDFEDLEDFKNQVGEYFE